ncbi:MAG: serine hydroxymethyltransferase [Thermoplasmata archaeon]|nr:serine hydroxymethyltransferase [Thermoplasmata archaeon]
MAAAPTEEARLLRLVRAHDRWRGRSVFNLLPSENAVSPVARSFLSSDLAGRYTLPMNLVVDGEPVDNSYTGTKYTDEVEALGNAACARVFRAKHATVRPLSGHIAAMSALVPLLPKGARLLAISSDQGGYDGYGPGFLPAMFGWTVRPLPADGPGHSVRAETAVAEIRRERPTAVVLGQSFFLFPYPLREIAEAAHAVDALVFYDGSHVLGLIAGGEFQDPLREGADVLYGSTHKSFPGPQGGIVATDRTDLFEQLDPALVWRVFDNAHWNRIAGIAQTLLELERVGPEYARTVVQNAQALGRALTDLDLPVLAEPEGFTKSHQLLLDRPELKRRHGVGPVALARRWERQRLLADLVGRLGTAEVTRLGLTPPDMARLAGLLVRAGIRKEKVGPEVLAWRREFPQLRFA